MSQREIVFWTCDEFAEEVCDRSIHDAVQSFVDQLNDAPVPETVQVFGWARMERPPLDAKILLEDVLERLTEFYWEEYLNPEDSLQQTPAMLEAATAFCRVLDKEIPTRGYEMIEKRTVVVRGVLRPSSMKREG